MSLRPDPDHGIPEATARTAKAAFPKGSLAIRIRDALGSLFSDEQLSTLFPRRGAPAISPWRLAVVSVLQFTEGLSDRQAAQAVRGRIDWKYALSLELDDSGFDYSVLSEFRDRLIAGGTGLDLLDSILDAADAHGLLSTGGRARTDSTHVLAVTRDLTRLAMVIETLRAALNAVAEAAPQWLTEHAAPEWFERYIPRADEYRLPKSRAKRTALDEQTGADGMQLLDAVCSDDAPHALRELEMVDTLRRVWIQQYQVVEGTVRGRDPKNRPPGSLRLVTPYDVESRRSGKRDMYWDGFKVQTPTTQWVTSSSSSSRV